MMLARATACDGRLGVAEEGVMALGTNTSFPNHLMDEVSPAAVLDELRLFSEEFGDDCEQDALDMMALLDEPETGLFNSEWGVTADTDMYPRDYEEAQSSLPSHTWPLHKPRDRSVEGGVCVMVPAGPIAMADGTTPLVQVCIPASPVISPRAGSPASSSGLKLTGCKRQRPADSVVIVSEAAITERCTKRPRVRVSSSGRGSPRAARRPRSAETLEALRAADQRATAQIEAMVAAVDPDANARRLAVLASVKRNGNYDSYVTNAALPVADIPLQVSLVGTQQSPGLLTALQQTKRKGVTDMYLLEHPRGIPKWCLFFRSCFHRLAKVPRVGPRDPFFEMFRCDVSGVPSGAFLADLQACADNEARVAYLAGQLARLVSLVRPDEPAFFLPPAFLAGIAADASVANCLKIQCQLCGGVQGWRTCRGCYKSKRTPPQQRARARSNSGSSQGSAGVAASPVSVLVVPTPAPAVRSTSGSSTSPLSSRAGVTATHAVTPVPVTAPVVVRSATVIRVPKSPSPSNSTPCSGVVLPVILEALQQRVASHRV